MPPARRLFLEASVGLARLGAAYASPVPAAVATGFEPAYLSLHRSGELRRRADALWAVLESCRLCPRECGADRARGESGFCRSVPKRRGELPPPSLRRGAVPRGPRRLGDDLPLQLQPALRLLRQLGGQPGRPGLAAERRGAGRYDARPPAAGLPQRQRGDPDPLLGPRPARARRGRRPWPPAARRLQHVRLGARGDPEAARRRRGYLPSRLQVLGREEGGQVLLEGRHLPRGDPGGGPRDAPASGRRPPRSGRPHVPRPHDPAPRDAERRRGDEEILAWIAANLPKDTYVNVMSQYRPTFRAFDFPEIARAVSRASTTKPSTAPAASG